jgi:hypothetical protein
VEPSEAGTTDVSDLEITERSWSVARDRKAAAGSQAPLSRIWSKRPITVKKITGVLRAGAGRGL